MKTNTLYFMDDDFEDIKEPYITFGCMLTSILFASAFYILEFQ